MSSILRYAYTTYAVNWWSLFLFLKHLRGKEATAKKKKIDQMKGGGGEQIPLPGPLEQMTDA